MRILHFISSPAAGGAEIYVRDLSIVMRECGHDIHMVFLQSAAGEGRDLKFEKQFLESLSQHSITYSFIGKDARSKPWVGGARLRHQVRVFNPDVIHCHLYYALIFSFFVLKTPVVYTHHSFELSLPRIIYRFFDFRVKAYIGICSACTNLLRPIVTRDVIQIDNAADRRRTPSRSINRQSREELVFVFVGSLRAPKNLKLMLNSFSVLKNRNAILKIAGEGPDRNELEILAKALDIDKKVQFLGNISNVGDVLADADVFLMSSAWEGLPIALIEATLIGLPVIVTNVGGCAEVVHRCANGFVVDSLDVIDYRAALEKMMNSAQLRLFFSQNAMEYSMEYEIHGAVEKHLDLYHKVV